MNDIKTKKPVLSTSQYQTFRLFVTLILPCAMFLYLILSIVFTLPYLEWVVLGGQSIIALGVIFLRYCEKRYNQYRAANNSGVFTFLRNMEDNTASEYKISFVKNPESYSKGDTVILHIV